MGLLCSCVGVVAPRELPGIPPAPPGGLSARSSQFFPGVSLPLPPQVPPPGVCPCPPHPRLLPRSLPSPHAVPRGLIAPSLGSPLQFPPRVSPHVASPVFPGGLSALPAGVSPHSSSPVPLPGMSPTPPGYVPSLPPGLSPPPSSRSPSGPAPAGGRGQRALPARSARLRLVAMQIYAHTFAYR